MGEGEPVRVAVIEDHPMMRTVVETTLTRAGLEVVTSASSAATAYSLIGETSPDVAVIDIGLPDESGIELTRRLLRRDARLAVVIHTGREDALSLKDALDCGARGFAYKTGGVNSLLLAVRAAAAGGTYIAPELREAIRQTQATTRPRRLSDREREVLALVADGLTNEAIAARLMLSVETIRTHIRNSMRKLDARTRAHALMEALRGEEIGL